MRTIHCPAGSSHSSNGNGRGNNSNSNSSSVVCGGLTSSMSPSSSAILTLAVAFLLSAIPLCKSAPVLQKQVTTDYDQLLSQVDDVCTSFLSEDLPLRTRETLGVVCVQMLGLLQSAQDLTPRANSKRFLFHYAKSKAALGENESFPVLHPLIQLVSATPSKKQARRATAVLQEIFNNSDMRRKSPELYNDGSSHKRGECVLMMFLDLEEYRTEGTFFIGREMEEDPLNTCKDTEHSYRQLDLPLHRTDPERLRV